MVLISIKSWLFGDSDNDLEMLAGVGMSVAMGNGSSSVKEVAKHINCQQPKRWDFTRLWNILEFCLLKKSLSVVTII